MIMMMMLEAQQYGPQITKYSKLTITDPLNKESSHLTECSSVMKNSKDLTNSMIDTQMSLKSRSSTVTKIVLKTINKVKWPILNNP